jgi:hypothetical protein
MQIPCLFQRCQPRILPKTAGVVAFSTKSGLVMPLSIISLNRIFSACVVKLSIYFCLQKALIKERINLPNVTEDMWQEKHEDMMDIFIENSHRLLVGYLDPINGLVFEHNIPTHSVDQLTYFIKTEKQEGPITQDVFLKSVQYGTVRSNHIESLLRLMMGIYAPIFFENTSWPDSILL